VVWATCSDVVEMLNRTDVLLNNEQADAKTMSLLLFCKYVYIRKQKSGNKVVHSCFCAGITTDGILYCQIAAKNGRPPTVSDIKQIKQIELIRSCHQGTMGGHCAFQSTLE